MLNKLLCKLGIHKWLVVFDREGVKKCTRCPKFAMRKYVWETRTSTGKWIYFG